MGIAELVPGVSGGTIAFVTGIYTEFVRTLAGLRPGSLVVLWRDGWGTFWRVHNLEFLLALGIGMIVSVFAFARLFSHLILTVPPLVWSFFFGLIAASVVRIGAGLDPRALATWGIVGLAAGLAMLALPVREADPGLASFFAGGFVAVSAWLLPAVSGSFMLLVLGLYEPALRAVSDLDVAVVATLVAGCVAGILVMSRILSWMLSCWREPLIAGLTGFMAGSLARLWPWQAEGRWLMPPDYQVLTGVPALVTGSFAAVITGIVALWLLSRLEQSA
jgi:putative membrane protein